MRFRAAFVTTALMKATHFNKRSLKQNSNRLAAYLATGIGAGLVATPVAEAAIVTIDLTSTGFDLDGVNAGLDPGMITFKPNFPISGGGNIVLYNSANTQGFFGAASLRFAVGSANATPVNFALNQSIDSLSTWSTPSDSTYKRSFFRYQSAESADFGSGSYMGFKTAQGNYGWLEATWAGATDTFQIYSGAYESDIGVAILAGDTGTSAVPEPGQVASSLLVLALGAAGVAIQRQRVKKKQAEAVSLL
jgi:hypothetical protein